MRRLRLLPRLSVISLLISQSFLTVPVFAAGFQLTESSPSLQGDALAGAAAANNDVSALFINPATLSTLKSGQAYFGGNEIMPNVKMSNGTGIHTVNTPGLPPSSLTAPVIGQTSQPSVSKSAFVPDGYFGMRFNDRLTGGIGLAAPFGLTTKYYDDSVLRFAAVYSSVKTIDVIPSIAYQIDDQWAIGLGLEAQYMKAIFSNFNGPYTSIPVLDQFVASNFPTYLKGSGWGFGGILGVMFKPDCLTRIGLAYRTQIAETLIGTGQQYVSPGATVPAPSQDFLFNADTNVEAATRTPAILTLGVARDIDNFTVKATAQVNFWRTFNQLTINMPQAFATNSTIQTRWRNAWFASLGADYRFDCMFTLRAGVAYDQSPTRDEFRDPRIPDANRYWLTLGGTYQATKQLSFDGVYEHIFFPNQTVNVTQASGTNVISPTPLEVNTVSAKYKGSANIVGLAVRYSF